MERDLRRVSGLTLVEQMMVITVLGLLAATAAPTLNSTVEDVHRSALVNGFLGDLALARSEAIRTGRRVVVCKSADGIGCGTTGGWEQGRIVFEDENNDAVRSPSERLIRSDTGFSDGWLAKGNQNVANYISYHPMGHTRLAGGAFQAGTLTLCKSSPRATLAVVVVLNIAGRARSQRVSVSSCS